MDLFGSFVSHDTFHVVRVTHGAVLGAYPVRPHHRARSAGRVDGHSTVVSLCHRDVLRANAVSFFEPSQGHCLKVRVGHLGQHVREFDLADLKT